MAADSGLAALRADLATLEAEILSDAAAIAARWAQEPIRPGFTASAENLAHYLALRGGDRTELQRRLRAHGLSSLGRSDGHVLGALRAVRATLDDVTLDAPPGAAIAQASARLAGATAALFGPRPLGRRTHILVTLQPALADDDAAMQRLVRLGMDAVRINCAHDTPEDWARMARAARQAAAAAGCTLRVCIDLAGPKIRTVAIQPRPGIRVRPGDRLRLWADQGGACPEGARASLACTLPAAAAQVAEGAAVALDDGKILGLVKARDAEGLWIEVVRTKPGGARLKPDKGLNFPGTALAIEALTPADLVALDAMAGQADVVGYSFVQDAADIAWLADELARRGAAPGILAKIETERAFANLPGIIVAGAGRGPFGVMIARGDLAVEVGFARMAEVQEEILWLCEAAHVPVVWATEVLAGLVRNGLATRGEITDAAMGARAECVMLNKGPFIAEGVEVLADVLRRAERHLDKKTPQLPRLKAWQTPVGV